MNIEVFLQNDAKADAPTLQQFQYWTKLTLDHISKKIPEDTKELCIRIVDNEESAYLNETFRKKKGATNILSFPPEKEDEHSHESLGDLAICADILEQEAKSHDIALQAHWAHLTVHGILHLLGYDHEKENEAHEMENLEIKILKELGYDNPYQGE